MTIQELLTKTLRPKEFYAVDRVTALVVSASEHKEGENEKGSWSRQLLQLRDPHGGEALQAIVWNHSDLSHLVGKVVDICAYNTRDLYLENYKGNMRLVVQGGTIFKDSPVAPQPVAPSKSITLEKAAEVIEYFHNIAKGIYPEDAQAAAAVGNTLFIAWVKGQIVESAKESDQ